MIEINWDSILIFGILFALAYMIYTRMKNQNLNDTWEEILELFPTRSLE